MLLSEWLTKELIRGRVQEVNVRGFLFSDDTSYFLAFHRPWDVEWSLQCTYMVEGYTLWPSPFKLFII